MRYVYLIDGFGCYCGMRLIGFDDDLPDGAVDEAPPEVSDFESAKWMGSKWNIVPDYRRAKLYRIDDGAAAFVCEPGELPHGLTTLPRPSENHIWADGNWQIPNYLLLEMAAEQLVTKKTAKVSQLNAAAQAYIDAAAETDKVPVFEVQTWALQAVEAKAWAADNAAPTPVLDGIAAARGVPVEQLKAAALRKTLAYEALTAHIAGQRQALQTKIEAAKTQAELDKIVIAFTAPEPV